MKAIKILGSFLFLLIFSAGLFGQATDRSSLFISKYKANTEVGDDQEIVRYDLQNGEVLSAKTVFTSKTSDIRFDLGGNILLDKHILLNHWGDIIDLNSGRVLFSGDGELIGIFNKKVIFDKDYVKDDDLYSYDLTTGIVKSFPSQETTEELESAKFSPDRKLMVQWTSRTGYAFFSIDEKLEPKLIRMIPVSLSAECSIRCGDNTAKPPIVWLDNSRILTQRKNGKLIVVTTQGKVKDIMTIDIKEAPDYSPFLWKDSAGNITYDCGEEYTINVARKSYSTEGKRALTGGFAREAETNFWSKYFFNGEPIGRVRTDDVMVHDNNIAVLYFNDDNVPGSPDGLKLWSSKTRVWQTVEIRWGAQFIAWVED